MSPYDSLVAETAESRNQLLQIPLIQRALDGAIGRDTYVAFLTQAYHHVRHTVPLLMLTGARLPFSREWLRSAMAEYIDEEIGHELWILNDLRACGANEMAARDGDPLIETEVMVAYAYDAVQRINPLCMLGMVHVLEGTSVALASQAADAIQDSLKLPDSAFSYLRSHGCLDLEHVDYFRGLVDRLDAPELSWVTRSAHRYFRLYGNIFRALDVIDGRRVAA